HRKFKMQKGYYLKRRVSVVRRMLRTTLEPINKVMANAEALLTPHFQNSKEMIDGLYFYCDEISESIAALMNLHISLASQKTNEASRRTNEVMRVLTIFSCFFLPINFIASIYGMNFEFMPETHWKYGYFASLGLMTLVVLVIFLWFRRRGWLKKANIAK
ncbi:MAG TPA: CorA family divalent cation transporter, partial [Bdellovibrionales bacterium]|nr:CorA family divalent cation transporter [Bdellovibrionales bacterium]